MSNQGTGGVRAVTGFVGAHKALVTIAALAILGLVVFVQVNSADKEASIQEPQLSAEMNKTMASLGTQVTKIKQSLGIADVKSQKLDTVLTNAVKGRYGNEGGTTPLTPSGERDLISALVEAYPDLQGLDAYDQVIRLVESGWNQFQNDQAALQDRLANYRSWLTGGLWNEFIRQRLAGFPSDDLRVNVGGTVYRGQEAMDFMEVVVQPKESIAVYTSSDRSYDSDALLDIPTTPTAP